LEVTLTGEGRWPLLFSLNSSSKENEMGWDGME